MLPRRTLPWLLLSSLLASLLPGQLPLTALPKLARDRAERSRPAQAKALEPFWADFALDYRSSQQVLDQRIAEAAALGDSVVPLLLEKLQPAQAGEAARNLSSNCRRVLERLDPASFTDALAELATGNHELARAEAIRLLGCANTAQSVTLLTDLVDRTVGEDRRLVVRSLRLLKAAGAAARIVPMLGSNDRQVREDVLAYLIAARPPQVVDTVVQALANEKDNRLLPSYVEYFLATVHEHDAAARALLPLLDRERLDWLDRLRLVQALATIAPRDHEPTCRKMHELIDTSETSSVAVQAAVTLRALGDKSGVTKLQRTLNDLLRKPQRKKDALLYEQRANLAFATEEYTDAFADYEKILDFSDGIAMTRRAYMGMIRCEAHRKKVPNLLKIIRASGMLVSEVEAIGLDDAVLQETLQQDKVKTFLQALAKEQAPK